MASPLAPQYVHGVYIPSALLIVGTAIVKKEWLPYAVALAAILGGWKVYSNRKIFYDFLRTRASHLIFCRSAQGAQAERIPGI